MQQKIKGVSEIDENQKLFVNLMCHRKRIGVGYFLWGENV